MGYPFPPGGVDLPALAAVVTAAAVDAAAVIAVDDVVVIVVDAVDDFAKLVVEAMDVPKREELVQRIRKLTGVEDPDADPQNPSPETLAMREQALKQMAMAERAATAQIAEQEARARMAVAQAAKTEMSLTSDQMAQLVAAMQTAISIAGAPAVAQAADQVLMQARGEAMAATQPAPPPPEAMPQQPITPDAGQMMQAAPTA